MLRCYEFYHTDHISATHWDGKTKAQGETLVFMYFQTADSFQTFILRSAFSDDTLTATDNMLRASRPMHSEGVDDLSGPVSDW